MEFTTEQELVLLLIGWVMLIAGFIIWEDYEQKTIIRTLCNNRLEWTWHKNQEHEEKETTKEK